MWLSEKRGPSMYGDEIAGKPASQLFTLADSKKALGYANEAVKIGKRFTGIVRTWTLDCADGARHRESLKKEPRK